MLNLSQSWKVAGLVPKAHKEAHTYRHMTQSMNTCRHVNISGFIYI